MPYSVVIYHPKPQKSIYQSKLCLDYKNTYTKGKDLNPLAFVSLSFSVNKSESEILY